MSDQEPIKPPQLKLVERPNFRNPEAFEDWLSKRVQTPYKGFEDKGHPSGKRFTGEKVLESSREQVRKAAKDFSDMGRSDEQVQDLLLELTEGMQKPPAPPISKP